MATTTIYVAAHSDTAKEEDTSVFVAPTYLEAGDGDYVMGGFIIRTVPVPPGSALHAAVLGIVPYAGSDDPNLTIRGEIDPADFAEVGYNLSDRTKTAAGAVWAAVDIYAGAGVYVSSPDVSAVVREIIGATGWAEDDDIGFYLLDRGLGGYLAAYAWESGTAAPRLYLEWTPPQAFAFPGDYWPTGYWPEYWPDYGTATTGAAVAFMYYQRMRRRGR